MNVYTLYTYMRTFCVQIVFRNLHVYTTQHWLDLCHSHICKIQRYVQALACRLFNDNTSDTEVRYLFTYTVQYLSILSVTLL